MEITGLLKIISAVLENIGIPYVITGGVAVSVWGRTRYTADIDIVLKISAEKIKQLVENLLNINKGNYLDIEKNVSVHVLKQKGSFNFIHSDSGLKVDFMIAKDDEISALELKRAVIKKFEGQKISFISPEDLILSKLLWHKESNSTRHLEDIESVLKITKIDLGYIKKWAIRQSTNEIFENLLKK